MNSKFTKITALLVALVLLTAVPGFNAYAEELSTDVAASDENTEKVTENTTETETNQPSEETTEPTTNPPTTEPATQPTTKPVTETIESIRFTVGESCKIGVGEGYQLYPKDQNNKTIKNDITYSSSSKSVVTVNSSGKITGKKAGTATITAKTKNGKKAVCKITVVNAATGLKLNITSASIGIGEKSVDLDSTLVGGYSRLRQYSSSNSKIASVDSSGVVTGIKEGTATITCTTFNNKKATCKITVGKKPTSVKITNSNNVIQKGANNHKVSYSLSGGAYSHKITYSISDTKIAKVDSKGYITGVKCGTTTLTVKTYNGLTATQKITVKDDSLSLNAKSTQLALDNKYVQKVKYGTSAQGRNLEAFVISGTNGKSAKKTLFIDFAIHGFEDEYYRDGQVLVKEANALIEYFANHTADLKNYTLVIVPCANPDGTIAGTNNQRACSSAFGRCTSKHIDMNRDWGSFKAIETKKLKDYIVKTKPDFYLNMHGWLDETLGDSNLNTIINKELGLSKKLNNNYPSNYSIGWVHKNLKIPATLVEYKSPSAVSTQKDINMIKAIINSNGKAPTASVSTTNKFPAPVNWKNGSTAENVFKINNLTEKSDLLKAKAAAQCYGKAGSSYIIVYNYGNKKHKSGFVKYAGGVKTAPTSSKTYKNKSSSQTVYADTSKKTKIGSLDPNEICQCLGKIDGMYLVVYKISGTSKQKCGFVSYNGGC